MKTTFRTSRWAALAAGLLISVSAVHSQDNSKIPSSYMPVDIHESFSAIMNRMTAATILFPAFRKIVSEHEYDALGEEFEKKEAQLFHGDGFEKNVDAVAKLEKELGIYDLAQFTPTV